MGHPYRRKKLVVLRQSFSVADPAMQEFLKHRADPTGSTWFEHCMRNKWTVERMMSGFEAWKRDRMTIDHEPSSTTPTAVAATRRPRSPHGRCQPCPRHGSDRHGATGKPSRTVRNLGIGEEGGTFRRPGSHSLGSVTDARSRLKGSQRTSHGRLAVPCHRTIPSNVSPIS